MPVKTWIRNANSVALPNTYIQPVRGGTGCLMIGPITFEASVRASNHSQAFLRNRVIASGDGSGTGEQLHVAVAHAHGILHQRPRRRPRGYGSVLVVNAAVAGAEEQLRFGHPAHGTAEMRAVDGERGEAAVGIVSQPCAGSPGDAGPRHAGGIREANLDRLTFLKICDRADRA